MAINNRILRRSKNQSPAFSRRLLPTLVGSVVFMSQAQAIEFNLGEIEGRFDSQISVGSSWRMDDPSSKLISTFNGGQSRGSGSYDDGNQNFSKGETFTQIVKGVHDLELRKDNVGFFGRAKYWYDAELEDGNRSHGHSPNGYTPDTTLNDSDFNDFSKFSGFEILDAYVFAGFDIGESEKPLDLRIGRQVINWGESTFIQGGLNSINPFDVNAFRRPGAEVKEGLLPVNMAFASLGVTDNLSIEGFYQFEWEPTAIDGCGTYFSNSDFAAQGCDGIRITLPLNDQQYFNPAFSVRALGFEPVIKRNSIDGIVEADDDGQFGFSAKYFAENLNNTEFGFYFAKYHSRLPLTSAYNSSSNAGDFVTGAINGATAAKNAIFSAVYTQVTGQPLPANPADFDPAGEAAAQAAVDASEEDIARAGQLGGIGTLVDANYITSYPEDIEMIGMSFNTNLGDVAWSGEISHKRGVPVQINGPLLVAAIMRQYAPLLSQDPLNPDPASGNTAADALVANAGQGGFIKGYGEFDITQAQTTFIKFYDQVLGASRLALIGELAWTHVHGLDEDANALKYGRNGAYGYAAGDTEGFVTQDSFGYVARAHLTYPNVFAGVNLSPQISFKHGIKGYGPQPGAAFNEGEKTLGLSLTADYLNKYSVSLSYTDYFGGNFNSIEDRDFISLSASVSF
ncbi:hypothetical protein XMG59_000666 [Marinobacterium sp. xm-g-59]|uniref:DUF1302 domain-containing protein n=1 Tax=Marinobacterium sp. xm-g-59 TaxID=2497748 RepID=UPI001569C227|nr:DUF1302 domain-containing protein [Marinobacterium sp. xm-g-59]NRP94578.1 hypothetical protein [Marinobacterium sp. xm-g-59]